MVWSGSCIIRNSSSIKICDTQLDSRALVNVHALTCESGGNFFRNVTFLADSNYGVLVNANAIYN
jgi:hypothetical protein